MMDIFRKYLDYKTNRFIVTICVVFALAILADSVQFDNVAAVFYLVGILMAVSSYRVRQKMKEKKREEERAEAFEASPIMQAAREALLSMGFSAEETDLALKDAPEVANEAALLQYALKRLGE